MSVLGLGYIGIGVSNTQIWKEFSSSVLGAQVSEGPDGSLRLRIDSRDWRIALEPNPIDDIIYAGWEVAGEASLEAVIARLQAAEVEVQRDAGLAAKRGVMGLARFTDAAGLPCELYWGATERMEKPFVSPAGVSGFVTGEQGLGHIVMAVKDIKAVSDFYLRVLGFSLSDHIDMPFGPGLIIPVTFLRCNPRHHSYAFAPAPPESKKSLIHFMLQTNNFDDVGFALDRCAAHGVDLSMTLGRHVNDHMVSFYAWTPSGFEIEYGWGARQVDDASWTVGRHDSISMWGHHRVPRGGSTSGGAA